MSWPVVLLVILVVAFLGYLAGRYFSAATALFSGANDKIDVKAVLSVAAFAVAILIYLAYAVKGLLVHWDMPAAVRDVTIGLILGGTVGAGATLLNQRLGITAAASVPVKESPEQSAGPVG